MCITAKNHPEKDIQKSGVIQMKHDLKAYPVEGRERRAYIASEVDVLLSRMEDTISSKDDIIRNLENRLQIRQRATPRTRSG